MYFGARILLPIGEHLFATCFRIKIFKLEKMHFTVNLTVNGTFYSNLTVNLSVSQFI